MALTTKAEPAMAQNVLSERICSPCPDAMLRHVSAISTPVRRNRISVAIAASTPPVMLVT